MRALCDALWRIGLRGAYLVLRGVWWLRNPEMHGAYVAVWQGDRLLLVRNSYRRGETVPCGAIARGESPGQAAVRELAEEVGIACSEAALRFAGELEVAFEGKRDHAHFFELQVPADVVVRIDRREVVWAQFVEREALRGRPLVPHVRAYVDRRGPDDPASKSAS